MLHVTTGVPGAGKTALTLWTVKKKADEENREVFYAGIPNLNLPWASLSEGVNVYGTWEKDIEGRAHWTPKEEPRLVKGAERWMELPPGAIIVIDECQDYFRPRARSAAVPLHVSELEKHRHRGHDIFVITQKPGLIDAAVKDLAGKHWHVGRKWGTRKPTVYEWETCQDITKANLKLARQWPFRYPAEVFTWYKSTEVDTHKAKPPLRVRMLPYFFGAALIFAAFATWKILGWSKKGHEIGEQAKATQTQLPTGSTFTPGGDRHLDTADYIAMQTPRVPGLPHTAPYYDQVTQAAVAPIPAGCISSDSRCTCYTQQGTKIDMQEGMCRQIVKNGFFNPFAPSPSTAQAQGPTPVYTPSPVPQGPPVAGVVPVSQPEKVS